MSATSALALMVLSAALHAAWNVALRRQADPPAASLLILSGGCGIALGAAALEALAGVPSPAALRLAVFWGLAAGASEGLYVATLSRALRIGPLAAVYAVSRGLPLLVLWPLSHALLGERVGLRAAVAVGLLLAGIGVLTPIRGDPSRTTTPAGYLWAVGTAVFNVTNSLVYKAALVRGAALVPLAGIAFLVATPIATASLWDSDGLRSLAPRLGAAGRAGRWLLLFGSACFAGSFLVALVPLRVQGAAWVLSLRNLSIAFAPLFAWAALGERPSRRALAGAALVVAGAIILGTA